MGNNLEKLPRFTKAMIKSHLIACGWNYDDLYKPIIAIANSWTDFNHGHIPQRQIAEKVKQGIIMAGGLPLEFNTIGPCDALAQGHEAMKYILPSREIMADSVEVMLRSQSIVDGVVLISSCDKITPAMLMAGLRLDLPCIHICSGTCTPTISFSESKKIRRDFLEEKISEKELAEKNASLYPHPGVCPYMGTANSMDIFVEALGLSKSYSSTIPAATNERMVCAVETGKLAVELANKGKNPSSFITFNSFTNALKVLASISGSLNHLIHVPAIAHEMGFTINFDTIAEINRNTPQLTTINPSGPHSIVDLHQAGGIPAIIKELGGLLDSDSTNVEQKTVREIASEAVNRNPMVIRPFNEPVAPHGGIIILKGNIARQGAAMRLSTIPSGMTEFTGPAIVFDSEEEATRAVNENKIVDGNVVIVRYEGPKGGPGMREMHRLAGAFVGRNIAVVTDGRFSGATGGVSVGYLSPEAALGGEIACIINGDEITIDITKCTINLNIDDESLANRMSKLVLKEKKINSRILEDYSKNVSSTFDGAIRH